MPNKPTIVCLCGSTRFMDKFAEVGWQLTLQGEIVLSVGVSKHAETITPEAAKQLDELHFRKIDLADYVIILNIGGYVGKSTAREIFYATQCGKPILYLDPTRAPSWVQICNLTDEAESECPILNIAEAAKEGV